MVASSLENKLLSDGHGREKITPLLFFSCMVASTGGLLFGYEHSISGGVMSMESFLKQFFPGVYTDMKEDSSTSNYCKFNSQLLTLFSSSFYIAAVFATFFASHATTKFGRRSSMGFGGVLVFVGSVIGGAAINLYMLIFSRLLLGFGIGFTSQSVSLYISEMAPARYRGAIFYIYDIWITVAMLIANLVNYWSQKIESNWGWRVPMGAAAFPAAFLTAGVFFIPETPASIIQRGGDASEASALLQRIRGTEDVSKEVSQLRAAAAKAPASTSSGLEPLCRLAGRKYRPHLIIVLCLTVLQQLAGISLLGIYAPLMFRTIGLRESASLLSAVFIRLTVTTSTLVATPLIDWLGRRFFFFVGGMKMIVSLVVAGGLLAVHLGDNGTMSVEYAHATIAMLCVFASGFAWSWGPLPVLVASEIFPLPVRSAGRSIGDATIFLFMAIMAQGIIWMLCYLKWGIFFFFAGSIFFMSLFVYLFLPETKRLKLEEVDVVWKDHWYWKKFVQDDEDKEEEVCSQQSLPLLS